MGAQTFNMKFLVLAACVAVSAASNLVTHPNGAVVPADEPAVALARAAHLSTKGFASPYAFGGAFPYAFGGAYAHPYAYGALPYAYGAYAAHPYAYGFPHALVAHPNGAVVPADEPAVVAAKADHFAAHGLPVAAYHGLAYAGLVAHPNGAVVPAEPADVVAARAEHLAAPAE